MNRWTRHSSAPSRSVLAALAVVGGLALAGCGAGQVAQTAQQRPTVDGQNGSVGRLALRDVALEYPSAGVYKDGGDARLRMVVVNEGPSSDALVSVRSDAAQEVILTDAVPDTGTPSPTVASPSATATGTASGTPTGTAEPDDSTVTAAPGEPSDTPGATESGSSESPAPSATPTETETTPAPATRITIPGNGYVSFRDDGPTVKLTGLTRQLRPAEVIQVTFTFQNAGEITLRITVAAPDGEIAPAPTVPVGEGEEG